MAAPCLGPDASPVAFLSVLNRDRARRFYAEVLGLKIRYEDDFALVLDLGGRPLRISESSGFAPQPFTVLGWEVSDFDGVVFRLRQNDEPLERFEGLDQDANGVWESPSTAVRIAWFKDPDGNLLSISDVVDRTDSP